MIEQLDTSKYFKLSSIPVTTDITGVGYFSKVVLNDDYEKGVDIFLLECKKIIKSSDFNSILSGPMKLLQYSDACRLLFYYKNN